MSAYIADVLLATEGSTHGASWGLLQDIDDIVEVKIIQWTHWRITDEDSWAEPFEKLMGLPRLHFHRFIELANISYSSILRN